MTALTIKRPVLTCRQLPNRRKFYCRRRDQVGEKNIKSYRTVFGPDVRDSLKLKKAFLAIKDLSLIEILFIDVERQTLFDERQKEKINVERPKAIFFDERQKEKFINIILDTDESRDTAKIIENDIPYTDGQDCDNGKKNL